MNRVMSIVKMSEISVIGISDPVSHVSGLRGSLFLFETSRRILFRRLEECELCLWETQARPGFWPGAMDSLVRHYLSYYHNVNRAETP